MCVASLSLPIVLTANNPDLSSSVCGADRGMKALTNQNACKPHSTRGSGLRQGIFFSDMRYLASVNLVVRTAMDGP